MITSYRVDIHGNQLGEPPKTCPTCGGNDSELIHTLILGWECQACRHYRPDYHQDPKHRKARP